MMRNRNNRPGRPQAFGLPASAPSENNDVLISFLSVVGQVYRIEQRSDLETAQWATAMNNIQGTGNVVIVRMSNALSASRAFYRVVNL